MLVKGVLSSWATSIINVFRRPSMRRRLSAIRLKEAIGRNWQKRIGLARALTLRPEVLLIDNPLAGLDLRHVHWWLSFLGELSKGHRLLNGRPVTLAVSTADLRPWKAQARQFAILRNKRLAVLGTWAQLEAASEELVRELLPTELRSG